MIRLADAALALAGAACIVAITYLFRLFEAAPTTSWMAIAAIPAALAVLCFAVLALGRAARTAMLLLLISAGATVYLLEFMIQTGLWRPDGGAPAAHAAGFDTRPAAEVVADLRRRGKDAYPAVFPRPLFGFDDEEIRVALGDLLPLGGISRVTTVFCNETGRYMIYDADERGFNNPRGIWPGREADILALGDSFTHGVCVDPAKGYMALIRAAVPRTVTIGIPGNGPLAMLGGLVEYLPVLRSRMVLWFVFEGDDIESDLPLEQDMPILTRYLTPGFSQRLAERQPEIDAKLKSWIAGLSSLPDVLNPWRAAPPPFSFPDLIRLRGLRESVNLALKSPTAEYAAFEQILGYALERARGARLVIVYLPDKRRFVSFTARLTRDMQRARVHAIADRLGIPMVDVVPAFAAKPDPASLFLGHYNEAGHALVAAEVLKAIAAYRR